MVVIDESDYLAHYGILRRSGRYPWGSGGTQNVRNKTFLEMYKDAKRQGLSDKEFCDGHGITTTELRSAKTIANSQQKQGEIAFAQKLKDKGMSNVAIGQRMDKGESYVRTLLAPGAKEKADALLGVSNMLREEVNTKKFVDIGEGVENHIGISKDRLRAAVGVLREEGYQVHPVPHPQAATGHDTRMKVLVPPGVTQKETFLNRSKIQQISAVSSDGGHTFDNIHPPLSISPKRVQVNWAEDGGEKADGVIYVREGVKDVSLGLNRYAQVRIKVGNDHYLKGMAIYKDGLPPGVDLVFNTNKSKIGNKGDKLKAMKPIESDPELPFGSVIKRQILDKPGHPEAKLTSAMNIVNEQGDWHEWSRNISAQALSKQSPSLARAQLDMTFESRRQEYDNIMKLTNPVIKKKLLELFADGTDSAAVNLKAAGMDRQNWRVILPISSLKPTEVYAPTFRDGERVALIRYPHGGTFEIPELTVNNRHPESKRMLKDAKDAIGIHHSVAERLSGADFDGDTVLVIPNNHGKIKPSPALEGLKNFNPKRDYKLPEGTEWKGNTQHLMGDISNLITDMTIKGAPHSKIVRAVRHSMVVIDAERHGLDHKRSAADNGIAELKKEYQGGSNKGASTLISRAGSEARVPDRKARPQGQGGPIDPVTGHKVYVDTGKRNSNGGLRTLKSKKLAETHDAHTLVSDPSGTHVEKIYADHSNKLKGLANEARLSVLKTPRLKYSSSAAKTYSKEVASLSSKLSLAIKNKPLERQAQVIAKQVVDARRQANPNLDGSTLKKIKYKEQEKARARMGVQKKQIEISTEEWNAIQAGAVSHTKLEGIINYSDVEQVKELATPHTMKLMTRAKTTQAHNLLNLGYTRAEVADRLGVSLSTLDAATSGVEQDDNG